MGRFPEDPALLIKWNETILHYSCWGFTHRIVRGDTNEQNQQPIPFLRSKIKGVFIFCIFININLGNFSKFLFIKYKKWVYSIINDGSPYVTRFCIFKFKKSEQRPVLSIVQCFSGFLNLQQPGWTWKILCIVKYVRQRRTSNVCFHLCVESKYTTNEWI